MEYNLRSLFQKNGRIYLPNLQKSLSSEKRKIYAPTQNDSALTDEHDHIVETVI